MADRATQTGRCSTPIGVLVAHNGNRFDIPFLTRRLEVSNLQLPTTVKFKLDTLELARSVLQSTLPPNYKLVTLNNTAQSNLCPLTHIGLM